MNRFVSSLAVSLAVISACPLAGLGQSSLEKDPAYLPIDQVLDLKTIQPEVNINLPRFLLKDAVSGLKDAPGSPLAGTGIDLADLVKDVKLIRLVVIEGKHTNRPALDKAMKALRSKLEAKWTPIVSVPEENVGIYALGDPSGDSMAGLAVLVYNDGEAVIGNIVGHVSIGKLIQVASQTNKLPKDLLKKLKTLGNQTNAQSSSSTSGGEKPSKSADSHGTSSKESSAK